MEREYHKAHERAEQRDRQEGLRVPMGPQAAFVLAVLWLAALVWLMGKSVVSPIYVLGLGVIAVLMVMLVALRNE